MMRRAISICFAVLLSVILFGQTTRAVQPSPPVQLVITSVFVDFGVASTPGDETIAIDVQNFNNFDGVTPPVVTLGGIRLPVTRFTSTEIVAVFSSTDFPDGDYLLNVSTGPTRDDFDAYNLTIGAAGIQNSARIGLVLRVFSDGTYDVVFDDGTLSFVTRDATGQYQISLFGTIQPTSATPFVTPENRNAYTCTAQPSIVSDGAASGYIVRCFEIVNINSGTTNPIAAQSDTNFTFMLVRRP